MVKQAPKQTQRKTPKLTSIFYALGGGAASASVLALGAHLLISNPDGDDDVASPNIDGSINHEAQPSPHADPISQLIAETMGRRFVAPTETDYNAIGKVMIGGGHCSGQFAHFSGYTQTQEGMLVSIAGHCPIDQDPKNISFTTNYVDAAGTEKTFTTNVTPQVWINASYQASHVPGEPLKVSPDDNAILFFPNQSVPADLKPLDQYIFSHHMGEYNTYKVGTAQISVAGYAADLNGALAVDETCEKYDFSEGSAITTNCITNVGGSGGALLGQYPFGGVYNLAVVSGVTVDQEGNANINDENFQSILSPYYHYQLADISFLKKDDVCAKLTADNVNLRQHATVDSDINRPPLPFNDNAVLRVTSMLELEQAEIGSANVWIEVIEAPADTNYPYTSDGYIRADLLKRAPCPS